MPAWMAISRASLPPRRPTPMAISTPTSPWSNPSSAGAPTAATSCGATRNTMPAAWWRRGCTITAPPARPTFWCWRCALLIICAVISAPRPSITWSPRIPWPKRPFSSFIACCAMSPPWPVGWRRAPTLGNTWTWCAIGCTTAATTPGASASPSTLRIIAPCWSSPRRWAIRCAPRCSTPGWPPSPPRRVSSPTMRPPGACGRTWSSARCSSPAGSGPSKSTRGLATAITCPTAAISRPARGWDWPFGRAR